MDVDFEDDDNGAEDSYETWNGDSVDVDL